jgi:hypothetical protein
MGLNSVGEDWENYLKDNEAEKIEAQENAQKIEMTVEAIRMVLQEISLKPETVNSLEVAIDKLDEELGQTKLDDFGVGEKSVYAELGEMGEDSDGEY